MEKTIDPSNILMGCASSVQTSNMMDAPAQARAKAPISTERDSDDDDGDGSGVVVLPSVPKITDINDVISAIFEQEDIEMTGNKYL